MFWSPSRRLKIATQDYSTYRNAKLYMFAPSPNASLGQSAALTLKIGEAWSTVAWINGSSLRLPGWPWTHTSNVINSTPFWRKCHTFRRSFDCCVVVLGGGGCRCWWRWFLGAGCWLLTPTVNFVIPLETDIHQPYFINNHTCHHYFAYFNPHFAIMIDHNGGHKGWGFPFLHLLYPSIAH